MLAARAQRHHGRAHLPLHRRRVAQRAIGEVRAAGQDVLQLEVDGAGAPQVPEVRVQAEGLAGRTLGKGAAEVTAALKAAMWAPASLKQRPATLKRHASDLGGVQVSYAR